MIKPKISVIITVYNIEKYISECIESILKQSIDEIEVICIDDASTDRSFEILEKYKNLDNRVQVIRNSENIGPSSSRNIGYKAAQGEYIYQIDGDDYLAEGALERLYTCAKEHELDLLTFSGQAFADTKEMEGKVKNLLNLYIRTGQYKRVMTGIELFAECTLNNDFYGNIVFIFLRKKFFDSNNLYLLDGLYAWADSPFLFYIKAQRAMCISDALYMRRYRENSIVTSKKTMIKFESMLVQTLYEIDLWKQYDFDRNIEEAVEMYFAKTWQMVLSAYQKVEDKNVKLSLIPQHKIANLVYNYWIKEKNVYWQNQTSDTIQMIKNYENIIIFGAKYIADEVRKTLEKNNILNYIFAVSDNKNEKNIAGKTIYNIDELGYMCENSIVIIAVSVRHQKKVRDKLELIGFKNILVVE